MFRSQTQQLHIPSVSTSSFHPDTSSSFHPGTSCHSLLLNPRVQTPPRMMRGRFRTEGEEAKDTTVVIVSHPCLCRASQTGPQTQPQIPRPMRRQRDRQRDRQTHTHTHTHTHRHTDRQTQTDTDIPWCMTLGSGVPSFHSQPPQLPVFASD